MAGHDHLRIRGAHGPDPYTEENAYTLERAGGEWMIIVERPWFDPVSVTCGEPGPEPDPDRHARIAAAIMDIERDDDDWRLLGIVSDQAPAKAEHEWIAQRHRQTASDPATGPSGRERLRSLFRRKKD